MTGDAATPIAAAEPEAAVTIIEQGAGGKGFTFQVDGAFKTGPQIVKIVNASDQPHFVIVGQYPEPITMDQLQGWLMFDRRPAPPRRRTCSMTRRSPPPVMPPPSPPGPCSGW